MEDEKVRNLAKLLASRKDSFPGSPGFDDKVMRAIHALPARPATVWGGSLPGFLAAAWRRLSATFPAGRPAFALGGMLLAAIAAMVVLPGRLEERDKVVTRIKGDGFRFGLVLSEGQAVRRIVPEEFLAAGDRVQGLYWLAESAYVDLYSLDDQGRMQCHSCGTPLGRSGPASGVPLPFGLELDDSRGAELFILLKSGGPEPEAEIRRKLSGEWKSAGGDLGKVAERLADDTGKVRFRTLLVRKGKES